MLYITGLGWMSQQNSNEGDIHNGKIHTLHLRDGCAWGSSDMLHHLAIKQRNTNSARDLSNTFRLPSKAEACLSSGFCLWREKVKVNRFLHSRALPSQAHLILRRGNLHARLSSSCQSKCQECWWTTLSATDHRWRGAREAGWVHVKGSPSKGLL